MRKLIWGLALVVVILIAVFAFAKSPVTLKKAKAEMKDSAAVYAKHCAECHGADLTGALGSNLVDDEWAFAKTDVEMSRVIALGITDTEMPGFMDKISAEETQGLVQYIRNKKPPQKVKAATQADIVGSELINTEVWIDGLNTPWALVFLDADTALITEKSGKLWRVVEGKLQGRPIAGAPEVWDGGQGGLLDVAIDPDHADNGWVYLSYSHPLELGSSKAMTKLVRGKVVGNTWTEEQILFAAKPEHYIRGRVHFGSRITFDDKGHVFFSIGDRGKKDMAQDVTRPNGKIHRLMRDGSIPKDNPVWETSEVYPSAYSYGNRNPQGLVWTDGALWSTEHGPRGGDELNVIKAEANYGWPVISYGRNYSGTELTPYTHMEGMEQPISQWTPSIAACGLDVVSGDMFKDWNGYLLAGALKYQELRLIKVDGERYISEQILLKDKGRVRDVTIGPDGAIYVVLNGPGKILRITPNKEQE